MVLTLLVAGMILCAIQAIRTPRLLNAAIWLASASALLAIILYRMEAHEVAVIELSVGAGLVTVLFVFAITVAGEEVIASRSSGDESVPEERHSPVPALPPRALIWILVTGIVILLGWLILPAISLNGPNIQPAFAVVVWEERALDVLVQIVVIFAGVLGVLGLLSESETDHPSTNSMTRR